MNLWIDEHNRATHNFLNKWIWVLNPSMGLAMIRKQKDTKDPITVVSVSAELADEFLCKLEDENVMIQVFIHGGEPSNVARGLIAKHHWDRKVMDDRTAELIMVLKGQHELENEDTANLPNLGTYIHDVALYLSDDCMCPFSYYQKDPACIAGVVRQAVLDYMKVCDNPSFVLWQYFDHQRLFGDIYDDTQLWCATLVSVAVRDNGKYINGFSEENTKKYVRQYPFIP